MRISTGSGDRGMTSLFSGQRVPKSHGRIEANGDVDELNCVLGAVAAVLGDQEADLVQDIRQIQSQLMIVGASLSTAAAPLSAPRPEGISNESIARLEAIGERLETELPELNNFILPGGHLTAAWTHVARAVCRRAERRVVALLELSEHDPGSAEIHSIIVFLNRLSDVLFVLARRCNQVQQVPELSWP